MHDDLEKKENPIHIINFDKFPEGLRNIPDPPNKLYMRGKLPDTNTKILCIVGSRSHSSYGERVCKDLIYGLKGQDICIVSGLAIGIDTIAHKCALEIGLKTIAFPGSGLDDSVLYPAQNINLAEEILNSGGALISEFNLLQRGAEWTFPKRNRLMAGISHTIIIIEAKPKSGTLITARLATDYNKNVGAVPGHIFSELSFGPNELIRQGATPILNSDNILEILGLKTKLDNDCDEINNKNGRKEVPIQPSLLLNLNQSEIKILECLRVEGHNVEQLIDKTGLLPRDLNECISNLEINGIIKNTGTEIIFLG